MNIAPQPHRTAVTGASGLIGRALLHHLKAAGRQVTPVSRGQGENAWNVSTGELHLSEPAGALVHLAGRNIAARWTRRVRREIWDSRVPATQKLCEFLAGLPASARPRVLISASAIGIYGDRGDELLTESSPIALEGKSFLADVCRAWEAATRRAQDAGIRVVHARLGVVLARQGGALAKLRTPVKWGLGGPVGKGTQFLSWIALADAARLLAAMLDDENLSGPVNLVTGTQRQHEFIRTLGNVLHRPTVVPLPAFMVKLLFGRMGTEALLASQRVEARRQPNGYAPEWVSLQEAMRAALTAGKARTGYPTA